MKIIALGDIHMATSYLDQMALLATADLVIAAGDITNFGNRAEAKLVLNEILSHNRNLLCLAGNLDNSDVNDYLDDLGMNLHGQAHIIKRKVCVFGVGGSNYTPFGTPWEFSEADIAAVAAESHRQAVELIELAKPITGQIVPTILVSHAPPFGTAVDRLRNGTHVGSKAIRSFIERHQPDLCLCGHIHEGRGKDCIGKTQVMNLGMLIQEGWATIEIEHNRIITD